MRAVDCVVWIWSLGALTLLLFHGVGEPALALIATFHLGILVGVPLLRREALAHHHHRLRAFLDFLPLGIVLFDYLTINVMVAIVGRPEADHWLARGDAWIFGGQPSLLLQPFITPLITEVLILAYSSFYFLPFTLALLLYLRGRRQQFDFVALTIITGFLVNYVFYVLYPARGPRYFLMDAYSVPLKGLWLADRLVAAFYRVPIVFDCFPSGHTAVSLITLFLAYRYHRRYFWLALPVAVGIIAATIYGRFHYVMDVIVAVPFSIGILLLSAGIDAAYRTAVQELPRLTRQFRELITR